MPISNEDIQNLIQCTCVQHPDLCLEDVNLGVFDPCCPVHGTGDEVKLTGDYA